MRSFLALSLSLALTGVLLVMNLALLRSAGTPAAMTNGVVMTRPTSITQATEDADPITFTAREDIRLLLAKKTAVSRPKTMLITARPY